MDILPYSLGVDTTDTFDIWRKKTNGVITKITSGSSGANPDVGYPTWTTNGDIIIGGTSGTSNKLTANDIYCKNIYSGRNILNGVSSLIELGSERAGDGNAILNLHSTPQPDYDARIHKESGRNGIFNIVNRGTGAVNFTQETDTGNFVFRHAGNERLVIGNAAVTVGTAGLPIPLTVNGNITASGEIKNQNIALSGNQINAGVGDQELALSYKAYIGTSTNGYNTTIYDGRANPIVVVTSSTKAVSFANTITASGAVSGTSLIATSSGAITGGALTCTSLTTQSGNISCGNINTSGIYTQTGKTKPTGWGGGVTTFDVYSDGGTIGIGVSGTILASMSNIGAINGTSVTSTGEISGSTLRTDSKLTFTAGTGNGSTDVVTIERVNPLNDQSELRVTIGDNVDGVSGDALVIGTIPSDVWTEKLRVTSGGNVTTAGFVKANGDIVAYNSSDSRLKENVKVIPDALSKVSQLSGVTFDWNDQQTLYSGNDVGVIAQEVEAVLPQIVTTRADGYKAVKYERLVALLIESVKELKQHNEQLQSRIYSLEQHVNI